MNYNVQSISVFERQTKRLIKKFTSLKEEIHQLILQLKEDAKKGTSLGNNCYKIRLAISSKGKGKSGGARIITHIVFKNEIVYLLSIFDKSEMENLSNKETLELIQLIPKE